MSSDPQAPVPSPSAPPVPAFSPTVFISYARDSAAHRDAVLAFGAFLRSQGINAVLDSWFAGDRRDWHAWTVAQMSQADYVVAVASPQYRMVGDGLGSAEVSRGVQSEAALLRELVIGDRARWLPKVLPVILPDGGRVGCVDDVPLFLQPATARCFPLAALTVPAALDLLRVLLRQPAHVLPPVLPRTEALPEASVPATRGEGVRRPSQARGLPPAQERSATERPFLLSTRKARPRKVPSASVAALATILALSITAAAYVVTNPLPFSFEPGPTVVPGDGSTSSVDNNSEVYNEYPLEVRPGYGYDLDNPPGQDRYTNAGWRTGDPGADRRDLYRTKADADKIGGYPIGGEDQNRAVLADLDDSPEHCRTFTTGGGSLALQGLTVGSRICILTTGGRWAMVTITDMPDTRSSDLGVHVTVLVHRS
jgi:hypothetical protein